VPRIILPSGITWYYFRPYALRVCVYVSLCMHACIQIYIHTRIYIYIYIYMCVCVKYVCMHVYMYICMHVRKDVPMLM